MVVDVRYLHKRSIRFGIAELPICDRLDPSNRPILERYLAQLNHAFAHSVADHLVGHLRRA